MRTNDTNNTNNKNKIIYPEISYVITGICFAVHNDLGRFAKEKQYSDEFERKLKEIKIPYKKELRLGDSGNVVDFLIDDKLILEFKAKRILTKEDYYQTQRYLQALNLRLGVLINFRDKYLKPKRIIKIDTINRNEFVSHSYH
ncbi:MAG: GxxExxY protein [Candidatus Wolfebacteria bacterium]|nr:GxxExxY protein [Candidatus Wolfebacteria bacterium]